MTLDEFIKEMHEDIEKFKKSWIENNRKNEYYFPNKLEPGEWFEMFMINQTEME